MEELTPKEQKFIDDMKVILDMLGIESEVSVKQGLTTDDFCVELEETLLGIEGLFLEKNKQYSDGNDILSAFIKGAERRYGEVCKETVLDTILAYKDKHDLALLENGLDLPDFEDRINDIIVYLIFAKLVNKHIL